jgi:hypothetical protein
MRKFVVLLWMVLGLSAYEISAAEASALSVPARAVPAKPALNKSRIIEVADPIHNITSMANKNIMLVIQSGSIARLMPDKKKHGKFKLTLYGVKRVLVYSDRSPIFVGRVENNKFVSFWNENIRPLASTPLQAALVFKSFSPLSHIGSRATFFDVSNPSYSPHYKSFSYNVSVNGGFYLKAGVYHDVSVFLTQRLDAKAKEESPLIIQP